MNAAVRKGMSEYSGAWETMVFENENHPEIRNTHRMLPPERPDCIHVAFDDHRLVANAGLLLPITRGWARWWTATLIWERHRVGHLRELSRYYVGRRGLEPSSVTAATIVAGNCHPACRVPALLFPREEYAPSRQAVHSAKSPNWRPALAWRAPLIMSPIMKAHRAA